MDQLLRAVLPCCVAVNSPSCLPTCALNAPVLARPFTRVQISCTAAPQRAKVARAYKIMVCVNGLQSSDFAFLEKRQAAEMGIQVFFFEFCNGRE
jgi:hypothetical protein